MDGQISFHICFFGKAFPLIYVLALLLVFIAFMGFGNFSIIVTFTLVVISSIISTFTKKTQVLVEEQEIPCPRQDVPSKPQQESEIVLDNKGAQDEQKETCERKKENQGWENHNHDLSFSSSDSFSESDGTVKTSTSEDSELEWSFGGTVADSLDFSRSSISDEDNFIEITLPSGQWQSVSHHKEDLKFNQQHKCLSKFTAGVSSLKQQVTLMDLLSEINDMNEEENLIEIDILMGSIKCPRFEIEA